MCTVRRHTSPSDPDMSARDKPPTDPEARHQWFCRLSDSGQYLFHGSSRRDIDRLSVRRASTDTTVFGRREQVFATPDVFWAMWFAVLDRSQIQLTSNACFVDREAGCSYYTFGIDEASFELNPAPLRSGCLYVLPSAPFSVQNTEESFKGLYLAEYGSSEPVVPIVTIPVDPSDFPFVDAIRPHEAD